MLEYDRDPFIQYYLTINQTINLTSIRDPEQFYTKHIVDSLILDRIFDIQPSWTICDIWTWWWFPLLPLAIAHPQNHLIWLDSVAKKLLAIESIVKYFGLTNVTTQRSRSEQHKKKYDLITCRAVAYADKLIPTLIHLVKSWWYIVLYKLYTNQEDMLIDKICHKMKLSIIQKYRYRLFEQDCERIIYIIQYKT